MDIEFNVIAVLDRDCKNVLMCKRRNDPYQGLHNLVGGKIEKDEDGINAAYRELEEETGITNSDIQLTHLIDFTYHLPSVKVEVYVGRLNKEVAIYGDENDLEWIGIEQNFFDISRFAGEGNIGHIMEHIYLSKEILLK